MTELKFIQKRNKETVKFDETKITEAIWKAAKAVGGKSKEVSEQLTKTVVEELKKNLREGENPSVEFVQDIVEKALIESGHAKTAKAYILYRQERAKLRKEKQLVLEKNELDEVDKRFDVNALRVLKSRYLKKNEEGKLIETPKELFTRVAVHAALPDLLYDEKIFDLKAKQPTYSVEEFNVKENNLKYSIGIFALNEFHLEALKRMYDRASKNKSMKVSWSTFVGMLDKGEFDSYEKNIEKFYNVMTEKRFMPNTPAIANFGSFLGMGSACFALGVEDSIDAIMETLKSAAIIFKSGGGLGYNFSKLRPEGDFVSTTSGVASGPLSFMTLFDKMTEVIKQGGIRRGANMGILNSNHPDIERFVLAKAGNKALTNFNISVLIMPDFWEHYHNGTPYPLRNPRTNEIVKTVDARLLFDRIVYQAWESAEPGVIFFDKVNETNPFYEYLGPIVTTNPCFTKGTKIKTEKGVKSIEEVKIGEIVLTHLGRYKKVYHTQVRRYTGKLYIIEYQLNTKTVRIEATEEHPFLSTKQKDGKLDWINANQLEKGNYLAMPIENSKTFEKISFGSQQMLQEINVKYNLIEIKSIEGKDVKSLPVYNFAVEEDESYIANEVAVHNCGEVLLYPNEPCNLGSINVQFFAKDDETGKTFFDWEGLKETIFTCTRFLDNVIDVNNFPLPAIEEMALKTRKIGLGIMGLGDLMYELRIPFNTEEGRKFMEQLMEFVNYYSKVESIELAKTRGKLPLYDQSFYKEGRLPFKGFDSPKDWHFDWNEISEKIKTIGIRNGYTTIIAPTGSISMIAGTSSGMEPVYSLVFEKNVKVGSFFYADPVFEKAMKEEGLYDEKLMEEICNNCGSVQSIPYVPQSLKDSFVTAMDITPEEHIRALASFQKWTDSSISKTNNFPANATVEDMRQSYLLAYQLGCKDVTVFRDSSIKNQVLNAPKKKEEQETSEQTELKKTETKPNTLTGTTTITASSAVTSTKTSKAVIGSSPRYELKNCPECSTSLQFKEGCVTCLGCGWGLCK